jgi:hypothetical protein
LKARTVAPALIAVLEGDAVLGGDIGTNSNIRADMMACLRELHALEAVPVLRVYARGKDGDTFLQSAAARALGVLGAQEAVNDLLPLLDERVTSDEDTRGEAAIALARIGDRKTWLRLIELAAKPDCYNRSEIISELNRQLDAELWQRIQTQKVQGLYINSVKTTVDHLSRESGIGIVLHFQPGKDQSPRASLDGSGYPWANTSSQEIPLIYGLNEIAEALSDDRIPRTFTFIFEDKQVHIISVAQAIEWWRAHILSAADDQSPARKRA